MYDLPNGTTWTQEIVESDFSNNQNPRQWRQRASRHLSPSHKALIPIKGPTRWPEGGVNGSRIIFLRIGLCPKIKTLGNLCARYWWNNFPKALTWSQQNYEASGRRMRSIGLTVSKLCSKKWSKVAAEKVQRTCPIWVLDLSSPHRKLPKIQVLLSNIDSWAMRHQNGWSLETMVISTQGTSSQRCFSQIQRFPFWFWINSKKLGFGGNRRNPPNRMG
jgi:hypothetical protein